MKTINVIGLGYIGLPTSLMLASHGISVVGTDYNQNLIHSLKNGKTTFKENGLEQLYAHATEMGIKFSTEYQEADVYIISTPTPYNAETKKIDASYIISALNSVLRICPKGCIVVIESTISPGTIDKFIRPLIEDNGFLLGDDIHLAHAPERIIPGNMIYELYHNSRTIGADSPEIGEEVKKIYASFCKGDIIVTDIRTAEMTKVVENTYRDINIAYANELVKICERGNMDVHKIIKIANMHPRVNILSPGPGVGGHCISVDPWFLVGDYPDLTNLIWCARKINSSMPEYVLERIYKILKENNISDISRVGFYGLTYKEDVDDIRESPTLQLLDSMDKHLSGHLVKVYDPYITNHLIPNQYYDFNEFLNSIDFIVIMIGHKEILGHLDDLANKIVLDTRGISDNPEWYRL